MATLNEKPVRLLMHDMDASIGLTPGQTFTREQAVQWFAEHYFPSAAEGRVKLMGDRESGSPTGSE